MSLIIKLDSSEALARALLHPIEDERGSLEEYTIAWFSAGVSSAVATKIMLPEISAIVYTHIDDQHPDSFRFVLDCAKWFDRTIFIIQSPYRNVAAAVRAAGGRGYINGPAGAACTRILKRRTRIEFESLWNHTRPLRYVWGLDAAEEARAAKIVEGMPNLRHSFPLITCGISKDDAHGILKRAGIKRPAMYDEGYQNNNCIGCLKGSRGYWNKIRVDYPTVFAERAALEREVGASCINGCFLDELPPDSGRHHPPICEECGIFCQANLQEG
jgi:hypothetical protein